MQRHKLQLRLSSIVSPPGVSGRPYASRHAGIVQDHMAHLDTPSKLDIVLAR